LADGKNNVILLVMFGKTKLFTSHSVFTATGAEVDIHWGLRVKQKIDIDRKPVTVAEIATAECG
jgi:hypothetical protein